MPIVRVVSRRLVIGRKSSIKYSYFASGDRIRIDSGCLGWETWHSLLVSANSLVRSHPSILSQGGPMAIKPLSDRVVLKRVDAAETVKGGIIIPDTAKEKPMEAEVVAVGEGKINENGTRNPMSVKAGNKVLIGKYSGTEVKIDGVDHVIVREDEILAIIS